MGRFGDAVGLPGGNRPPVVPVCFLEDGDLERFNFEKGETRVGLFCLQRRGTAVQEKDAWGTALPHSPK